jgi:hypothetical protein
MKLSPLAVLAVLIPEVFVAISLYKVTLTCPLSPPLFKRKSALQRLCVLYV